MKDDYIDIFYQDYDIGSETRRGETKVKFEDSESQIDPKYEVGPETMSEEKELFLGENVLKLEFRVDAMRYGIGKPRRVILRGKLSHD